MWLYDNPILELRDSSSGIMNQKILELQVILLIIQYIHLMNENTGTQKESLAKDSRWWY